MPQFKSRSTKRVVGMGPISFSVVYLIVSQEYAWLLVTISIVYNEISILGSWQVSLLLYMFVHNF